MKKNNCAIIGASASNLGALLMMVETVNIFKNEFSKFYIFLPFNRDIEIVSSELRNIGVKFKIIKWTPILISFSYLISNFPYLKKFSKINKALFNSEYTFDISGISFVEKRGVKYLIYNALTVLTPFNCNSKVIKLPQSFGPLNSKFAKIFSKKVLANCHKIFSRGEFSYSTLSNIGINSSNSLDMGLLDILNFNSKTKQVKTIGIVPSVIIQNKYKNQDYFLELIKLIKILLKENKKILIFNHTYSENKNNFSDNLLIELIEKEFSKNNRNIEFKSNVRSLEDLNNIYKRLDMVFTSRYHSLVYCIKYNVLPIVLGWNEKYIDLLEQYGLITQIINPTFSKIEEDFKNVTKLILSPNLNLVSKQVQETNLISKKDTLYRSIIC